MRVTRREDDNRKREAVGVSGGHMTVAQIPQYRRGHLYPSAEAAEDYGGDQVTSREAYARRQSARKNDCSISAGHGFPNSYSQYPQPHKSRRSLPEIAPISSQHADAASYPQNNNFRPSYRKQEAAAACPGVLARDEHQRKQGKFSILEALEHFEELADEIQEEDEDEILTQEPVRPSSPLHPTSVSTTGFQQLSRFQSFTDQKPGNGKQEEKGQFDLLVSRRPPTTNLGGASAAYADNSHPISSTNNSADDDDDLLLAIALQKEEDEYAAALRADRDRREDERRQLVMQLLEQVHNAPIASSSPVLVAPDEVIQYEAPESIDPDEASDFALVNDSSWITEKEMCPICLESLCDGLVVSLRRCNHLFHLDCLDDSLHQSRRCPKCRRDVRSHHAGTSPSGTMRITRPVIQRNKTTNGTYLEKRVIQIEYVIPDGVQKEYHDRPGDPYKGTIKVAYLPSNSQGNYLLKRLIFAFSHGITFRITRSSDGETNVVNWASIPHRFSLGEKEFESLYMANCNEALDELGVPTSFKNTDSSY